MKKVFETTEIGKLVRKRRKAEGLTQKDLSLYAGTGVRFISELERGKATCEIGKVILILNMLALDLYIGGRGGES